MARVLVVRRAALVWVTVGSVAVIVAAATLLALAHAELVNLRTPLPRPTLLVEIAAGLVLSAGVMIAIAIRITIRRSASLTRSVQHYVTRLAGGRGGAAGSGSRPNGVFSDIVAEAGRSLVGQLRGMRGRMVAQSQLIEVLVRGTDRPIGIMNGRGDLLYRNPPFDRATDTSGPESLNGVTDPPVKQVVAMLIGGERPAVTVGGETFRCWPVFFERALVYIVLGELEEDQLPGPGEERAAADELPQRSRLIGGLTRILAGRRQRD